MAHVAPTDCNLDELSKICFNFRALQKITWLLIPKTIKVTKDLCTRNFRTKQLDGVEFRFSGIPRRTSSGITGYHSRRVNDIVFRNLPTKGICRMRRKYHC